MKESKKEEAYVRMGRELGISFYYCESCDTSLDKIVRTHYGKILLAKFNRLKDEDNFLNLLCPKCKKKLNLSKLALNIEIVAKK